MARKRLNYGSYVPIRKGQPGYSSTARRFIDTITGKDVSRYEAVKYARSGLTYAQFHKTNEQLLKQKFSSTVIEEMQGIAQAKGYAISAEDVVKNPVLRAEAQRVIRERTLSDNPEGRYQRAVVYSRNVNRIIHNTNLHLPLNERQFYISANDAAKSPEFVYYDNLLSSNDARDVEIAEDWFDQQEYEADLDWEETP